MAGTLPRSPTAYLCSYPKSGRTWLRFILAHYFDALFELGLDIDFQTVFTVIPNDEEHPQRGLPVFAYWDRGDVPLVLATHALPSPDIVGAVSFLHRSAADAIVSFYFHHARQWQAFDGSLADYIRDPQLGVHDYIRYVNAWAEELPRRRSMTLSYEELSASPEDPVGRLLSFLSVAVDRPALRASIEASSFDHMQQLERASGIPGHRYDRSDPDALRVRRGEVGGHRHYLDPRDREYIERRCAEELSPAARRLLATSGSMAP